mmetsp:Transcript_24564/g.28311  ORF Transcript_24564/g.28311 Transcript_24564/m.28311 type:complete len:345 (+) Transcript_24564:118-1152(+)|eukprot:CAMPEP_0194369612 /NCGR_PEP_ID=MMETSP0174-20130528/17930_1 /TAXON_ID=216777 /ORGANISM="Proboscia alata, Strain PI-D3" /LENGTH=344 /DNA_ID=CAMNT_0039146659 /DNA_START=66 /DNA_END=1100 /DNA_ORIENTATION=+
MNTKHQDNEELQQQLVETDAGVEIPQQELFAQDLVDIEPVRVRYFSPEVNSQPENEGNERMSHWSLRLWYHPLIIVLTLQLGPMLYLTAHEGGHCLFANVLGMSSQLYLGCEDALLEGQGLFDPHRKIVVCAPFYYSLVAQHGFCVYDTEAVEITDGQDAVICIAGGLVGALAMYLLLLIVTSVGIGYQIRCVRRTHGSYSNIRNCCNNNLACGRCSACLSSSPLTRPFRLYSIIKDAVKAKVLTNTTAVVFCFLSWVIYAMNVNRLFYSLIPTTQNALRFPQEVDDLQGDGYDIWELTGSFNGADAAKILLLAQVFQLLQYIVQIVLFVYFVGEVRQGKLCGD